MIIGIVLSNNFQLKGMEFRKSIDKCIQLEQESTNTTSNSLGSSKTESISSPFSLYSPYILSIRCGNIPTQYAIPDAMLISAPFPSTHKSVISDLQLGKETVYIEDTSPDSAIGSTRAPGIASSVIPKNKIITLSRSEYISWCQNRYPNIFIYENNELKLDFEFNRQMNSSDPNDRAKIINFYFETLCSLLCACFVSI